MSAPAAPVLDPDALRRAQLAKALAGVQASAPTQADPMAGKVNPQVNAPIPPTAREDALKGYTQTLQTPAPSITDYHPSMGRRIAGALLGGIAGMHDPKSGYTVGHGVTYGPYDKQMTQYQQELARKKELYNTESDAEKETASIDEGKNKSAAELARAGAEGARQKTEEGKLAEITPGTPQYSGRLDLAKVEHPDKIGTDLYDLELNNGEKLEGVSRGKDGQFKDDQGNIIGPGAIKKVGKVGTDKDPKAVIDKPAREGEAGYIDKLEKKLGRTLTDSEQLKAHKEWDSAGRKGENSDSGVGDFKKQMQLQQAKVAASRTYQKNYDDATKRIQNIEDTAGMIDRGTPESLATAVPNYLKSIVGGQGSGFRMTQAEINNIIKARGWGDSIEAMASKISGHGNLSDKQKQSLKEVLYDVRNIAVKQRDYHSKALTDIEDAEDFHGINEAHKNYRKSMSSSDSSDKKTKDDNNVIKYAIDPKTGKYAPQKAAQ